jgi:hypothetical protein
MMSVAEGIALQNSGPVSIAGLRWFFCGLLIELFL